MKPKGLFPLNNVSRAQEALKGNVVGVLKDVSFSTGPFGDPGGAVELLGRQDSYVELPSQSLDTVHSIHILLYVYPMNQPGPLCHYKRNGHGVQLWYKAPFMRTPADNRGTLMARINRADLTYSPMLEKAVLNQYRWNFIGTSYNKSTGIAKLWYDGKVIVSKDIGKGGQ